MGSDGTNTAVAEQPDSALYEGEPTEGSETDSGTGAIEKAARGVSSNGMEYDTADSLLEGIEEEETGEVDADRADEGETQQRKKYLGEWETKEEAERGLKELQRFATQTRQELGEVKGLLNTFRGKPEETITEEEADSLVREFAKNPKAFIKKYIEPMADQKASQILTVQAEFEVTNNEAQEKAFSQVDGKYKNALTDEVLEMRSQLLTPGFDKKMTQFMSQINAGNYKTAIGGNPVDLEDWNHTLIELATEKAIARCHGKMVQKVKAEATRDTKRNERKKQHLGVHPAGGRTHTREDYIAKANMIRGIEAAAKKIR